MKVVIRKRLSDATCRADIELIVAEYFPHFDSDQVTAVVEWILFCQM